MGRPTLTLPNYYTLIVESGNSSDASVRWRNTWDIFASIQPQPTDAIINSIVAWHVHNARTDVELFEATLRHWSQGPQPFASRPFIWQKFLTGTTGTKTAAQPAGYGSEGLSNQRIPGSAVAFIKRQTSAGAHSTNMFLRGLLDDSDLLAETGGKYVLSAGSAVTPTKFAVIVASDLTPYLTLAPDPRLAIVHVGNHFAGPPFASAIDDLVFVGPSQNKQTRKNKR